MIPHKSLIPATCMALTAIALAPTHATAKVKCYGASAAGENHCGFKSAITGQESCRGTSQMACEMGAWILVDSADTCKDEKGGFLAEEKDLVAAEVQALFDAGKIPHTHQNPKCALIDNDYTLIEVIEN